MSENVTAAQLADAIKYEFAAPGKGIYAGDVAYESKGLMSHEPMRGDKKFVSIRKNEWDNFDTTPCVQSYVSKTA